MYKLYSLICFFCLDLFQWTLDRENLSNIKTQINRLFNRRYKREIAENK